VLKAPSAYREVAHLQSLYVPVPPPPVPIDFVIAYRPEGPLDLEAMAAQEAADQAALEQTAAGDDPEDDEAGDPADIPASSD
jgi:hypothetical protein